ncbi:hypothetical protein EBZ39_15650, partial [bacterium]|nr:hypothetical protein [bacterium]
TVVYTTGDQTISGVKTFNVAPILSGNPLITGVDLSTYLTSTNAALTYATINNLASTGSTLQTNINNLSGYVTGVTGTFGASVNSLNTNAVFVTGNQLINGIKTFNSGVVINVQPTGTNPALVITGTWNNASQIYSGIALDITDNNSSSSSLLMDLKIGGTSKASFAKDGTLTCAGLTAAGAGLFSSAFFRVRSDGAFTFSSTSNPNGSQDVLLNRDGPGIFAQRNGTNAQQFRVYNVTGTNSGEFGLVGWVTGSGLSPSFVIGSQKTSSGILRDIVISGANINLYSMGDGTVQGGQLQIPYNTDYNSLTFRNAQSNVNYLQLKRYLGSTSGPVFTTVGFASSISTNGASTPDIFIERDGTGILSQRNGTNPQQFRIYNSTGTNSGEFGLFGWQNNQLVIGSQATNSGISRDVLLTGNNVLLSGNNINVTTNGAIALPSITEPQTFGNNFVGMYNGNGQIVFSAGSTRVAAIGSYSNVAGIGIAPTRSLFFGTSDRLAGGNFVGDIYLTRNSAGVINQASSTTPQQYRIFNTTGTNTGEFGLFGWINSGLVIGPQQTNSGILRDLTLTGNNININASGFLNIFDNTNIVGNLTVSGNTTITGHLSAASKSFLIDHPTITGKKLQYGSLEGPEHGVFVRGKT